MSLPDLTHLLLELDEHENSHFVLIDRMLELSNFTIRTGAIQKLTPEGRERWELIKPNYISFSEVRVNLFRGLVVFIGARPLTDGDNKTISVRTKKP